jgi:putative phosphoribosyl transferase
MAINTKEMQREIEIPSGRRRLSGILRVPPGAAGVITFAHGSGSGRFSPRNQSVARVLEDGGLATLLLDLLAEDETEDRQKVFDIELLAERLQSAADWLSQEPETRALRLCYFGASTGAGAALVAAARHPAAVGAVVSRGDARTWPTPICLPSGRRPC